MPHPRSWQVFNSLIIDDSNAVKGEAFESLTSFYLKWDPKYRAELKNVWRLSEVPKKVLEQIGIPSQDQGIDLVAATHAGKYWAIQCKYHGDVNRKISHREISTFLSLSNSISGKFDFSLVCTTADDFAKIYRGNKSLGFILSDTWESLTSEFFDAYYSGTQIADIARRQPRKHQQLAITEAKKYFKKETRGKLIFPCGAGKSLTGYWISKELKAKAMIVAVPSLSLVKQTLEDYCKESLAEGNPISPLCVCSDEGIGKSDDVAVFTQDLGVPVTTSPVDIRSFLLEKNKRTKVVFTTYQSANKLGEAAQEVGFEFDLAILDEAHKTVGHKDKQFSYLLMDDNVTIKKRVFMTATERRFSGKSDQILSMDDLDVYGDTFSQLTFKEAIQEEILSDYKIVTLVVTKAEIKELIKDNSWISVKGIDWEKDSDVRTLASLAALRKAMQKFPIKHAVSFHSSIKRANLFQQIQRPFEQAFPAFGTIESFHVTGANSTSVRSRVIRDFAAAEKSLITNAKCLTEGVDVPGIDCVLFADPRKSTIDIVQAVGRALRKSKGKSFGYVLLPVFAESNTKESVIKSEDFQAILSTLRALASNDERIIEYLREKHSDDKKERDAGLLQFEFSDVLSDSIATQELVDSIELKAWDRLAKLSWRPFEEARKYVTSLSLTGIQHFYQASKESAFPNDIPKRPDSAYKNLGWIDWPDFLGTDNLNFRKHNTYKSYNEAVAFLLPQKLKSANEYRNFITVNKYDDLPAWPSQSYSEHWQGWYSFLNNEEKEIWDLKRIKSWIWEKKVSSKKQFQELLKQDLVPKGIPKSFYINVGVDFFYHETQMPLKDVKIWMKENGVYNSLIWRDLCKKKLKPSNIPSDLINAYSRDPEWRGYAELFEKDSKFLDREGLVEELKKMGISTLKEYLELAKVRSDLPYDIYRVYNVKNWDELTGVKSKYSKKVFKSFLEAKEFCLKNSIGNQKAYLNICFENGLPYHPERAYKNNGWRGWADFLGKKPKSKK